MGFFSNLKNFVTGAGASVALQVEQPERGRPFRATITAETSEAPCSLNRVYLLVRASEQVEIPDVEVAKRVGSALEARRQTVRHEETTYEKEIEVASAMELQPEQSYSWEVELSLPTDVLPSYAGKRARHEWKLLAGLDMRGNDPDSGWVPVTIA